MTTKCYYIPFSTKAKRAIKKAERKIKGIIISYNDQEEWTFSLPSQHLGLLEKILADVV